MNTLFDDEEPPHFLSQNLPNRKVADVPFVCENIAKIIKESQADIVGIQEGIYLTSRSGQESGLGFDTSTLSWASTDWD